jgi:hypothetical protein
VQDRTELPIGKGADQTTYRYRPSVGDNVGEGTAARGGDNLGKAGKGGVGVVDLGAAATEDVEVGHEAAHGARSVEQHTWTTCSASTTPPARPATARSPPPVTKEDGSPLALRRSQPSCGT